MERWMEGWMDEGMDGGMANLFVIFQITFLVHQRFIMLEKGFLSLQECAVQFLILFGKSFVFSKLFLKQNLRETEER